MKTRAVVTGGFLALAGVWAISAVGQSMMSGPAEVPPLTFEGREYVDSEGCVFIRAGIDGGIVWVPRVTRDRQPVCGYPPTYSTAELASIKSGSSTVATTTAASASLASDPQLVNDIYVPSAIDSYNTVTVSNGVMTNGTSGSANLVNDIFVPPAGSTAVSYLAQGSAYSSAGVSATPVRTGAPSTSYSSNSGAVVNDIYVGASGAAPRTSGGSSLAIAIPNTGTSSAPFGYKAAWDDGRINANRGPQSSSGDQQMRAVWTDSVPMQLASGNNRSTGGGLFGRGQSAIPFISSKSSEPQGSFSGFIQIGAFSDPDNVNKNISRIYAMGLGVAVEQSGSSQIVLAGPFETIESARAALGALQSRGYSDAVIR